MSTTTANLGLFKYDTTTDGNLAFNINTALNQNWDKIDAAVTGGSSRNVGEIISSIIPLTDAGLHLLDGTRLSGDGIYGEFVQYIADLYEEMPYSWTDYVQPTNPRGITSSSGFSNPSNVFDNNSSTYASCGTSTDYIEWDLGETLKVSGFNAQTQYVSSVARACNIAIYSVDDNNNETLIANGSGVPQSASGTSSAIFTEVEVNKLRFKVIAADGGQAPATNVPSRIVQINIIAQKAVKLCFCTEAQWQASVTQYGVCGKFVYDSVNNTVRLPKVTGILEGTTDVLALGNLVEAGLPNITGGFNANMLIDTAPITSGSFITGGNAARTTPSCENDGSQNGFTFDASRSSSIYGNSSTVQPQTIKCYYYIVIANSTKTDIQVDIDQIATDLNGKADVDFTNCTDVANIKMAHNAMPSDTYIDLTLGASETVYIAPADGWFSISKIAGSDWYTIYLRVLNENETAVLLSQTVAGYRSTELKGCLPVRKGQKFQMWYNVTGATNYFRFVYAQGSESEVS